MACSNRSSPSGRSSIGELSVDSFGCFGSDLGMAVPVNEKAGEIYAGLMAEIKERLVSAMRALDPNVGQPFFRSEYLAIEYVLIQLRMCIEALAFACAVAHDGLVTRKDFRKAYSADEILDQLSRANENFFPRAVSIQITSGAPDIDDNPARSMTQEDVQKLYRHCLGQLHRDRLQNILDQRQKIYDTTYIREEFRRFCWFLDVHMISIVEEQLHGIVEMGPPDAKPRFYWMVRGDAPAESAPPEK
jgi:hypothetical protein